MRVVRFALICKQIANRSAVEFIIIPQDVQDVYVFIAKATSLKYISDAKNVRIRQNNRQILRGSALGASG